MSRKASPTAIGAFVVGAIALAITGVLVLGSGRFFQQTFPLVAFFDGSVNGLTLGAPVKFKGVDIGAVNHIFIQLEPKDRDARIPVYFTLDSEKMRRAGVKPAGDATAAIESAIQKGLRAQLQTESFLTGVLYVELNYYPDSPATFVGSWDGTLEIPTMPTQLEQAREVVKQVVGKLDEIDFKAMIDSLTGAADGIRDFATSEDLKKTIAKMDEALVSIRGLSDTVEKNITPLGSSLTKTSEKVDKVLTSTAKTFDDVGRELRVTLDSVREIIDPEAPLSVDLRRSLGEVQQAAAALRSLADELDRNPSSLVFGRDTRKTAP